MKSPSSWRVRGSARIPCSLVHWSHSTERGIFASTQEETLLTEYYDDLTLVRNNDYLLRADITNPNILVWRGIQVGSTRSEVETAYPKAIFSENGAAYETGCDSLGPSIEFFFNPANVVERIFIKGWTAN